MHSTKQKEQLSAIFGHYVRPLCGVYRISEPGIKLSAVKKYRHIKDLAAQFSSRKDVPMKHLLNLIPKVQHPQKGLDTTFLIDKYFICFIKHKVHFVNCFVLNC